MARTPKPWYWKARKGWYVTIGGQTASTRGGTRPQLPLDFTS